MKINSILEKLSIETIKARLFYKKDYWAMVGMQKEEIKADALVRFRDENIKTIFKNSKIRERWEAAVCAMQKVDLPDGSGGINPGDRRAIFYIVSHFRPKSILEIGTHIGASTISMAMAQRVALYSDGLSSANLTTVDITDVNSTVEKPWMKAGAQVSPAQAVDHVGCSESVQFVTDKSTLFLDTCNEKFDFPGWRP